MSQTAFERKRNIRNKVDMNNIHSIFLQESGYPKDLSLKGKTLGTTALKS